MRSDEITVFHMENIIIYTRLSYMPTLQNIAEASKNYGVFQNWRRKIISYFCVRKGQEVVSTPYNVVSIKNQRNLFWNYHKRIKIIIIYIYIQRDSFSSHIIASQRFRVPLDILCFSKEQKWGLDQATCTPIALLMSLLMPERLLLGISLAETDR